MENVKLKATNEKGPRSKRNARSASKVDNQIAGPSWLDTPCLIDSKLSATSNNCAETVNEHIDAECSLTECNLSLELKERLTLTKEMCTESNDNKNTLVNGSVTNNQADELGKPQDIPSIEYVQYESELQMPLIMKIIQKDLSEPYSIYTYRYFIHNWPKLCFLAMCESKCVGAIVCKLDIHRKVTNRGYIAMLAVDKDYRKRSIGSTLVKRAIREMIKGGADEVVLETEVTNKPALQLYEALGFVRDKRLFRYYLNGVDALRLKLWLR